MRCVSLGVDVAEERKGLDVVALDADRRVVNTIDHATISDVKGAVDALRPDVVCIDSPPAWATEGRSRDAERQLRRLGITAYATPADPGPHPFYKWMRVGFGVFDAVAGTHPRFRQGPVHGTAIEVFPEASAVLLEGRLRSKDEPKVQFRRRVLAERGTDSAKLTTLDSVDAALAALTGLLALEGELSALGVPEEGVIVVPVRELPAGPLRRQEPGPPKGR